MIRLQMRRNETDLAPEDFERHAGLDARTLNAAADRDTVITVQSPQQRRLAGAVRTMDDPALTGAHVERDVFEHRLLVKIYRGVSQAHDIGLAENALGIRTRRTAPDFSASSQRCERRARVVFRDRRPVRAKHECVRGARRHILASMSREHPRKPERPLRSSHVSARFRCAASRPLSSSSSNSSPGQAASARASRVRRRSPYDNDKNLRSARSSIASAVRARSMRRPSRGGL